MTFRSILADYVLGGNLNNLYDLTGTFLLYSSSPPAAGTLVGSISPVAGVDRFGNPYPAGLMVVDGALKMTMTVQTFRGLLSPLLQLYTGNPDEALPFHILVGSSSSAGPYLAQIAGPANSGVQDAVGLQLVSGDNVSADAFGQIWYDSAFVTGTGTRTFMISWGVNGVALSPVASIYGVQPGTGGSIADLPAAESWHGLSSLYVNGWTDFGSGYEPGRYRLEPMAGGVVRLDGMLKPGSYTNNTTLFTLPVGYRPIAKHRFVCQADSGATTTDTYYELDITTGGVVTLQNIHNTTPGFLELTGITFPVD